MAVFEGSHRVLTYAEQPLIIPTAELAGWIESNIDTSDLTLWTMRAWPGPRLTKIAWPTGFPIQRKIQLNRLIWPTGASRWAYFIGLVDADTLATIQDTVFGEEGTNDSPATLQIDSQNVDSPGYELLATTMYPLPPVPLSNVVVAAGPNNPFISTTVNNLYLLPLVDQRWYWWSYSLPRPIATLTWDAAFEVIANELGITIEVDAVNAAYQDCGIGYGRGDGVTHEVLPPLLDALAANVGQRIYVDWNENKVFSQNFANAKESRLMDDTDHEYRTLRSGDYWYKDTPFL